MLQVFTLENLEITPNSSVPTECYKEMQCGGNILK